MAQIDVIVVSPEEAANCVAEFWCGGELMAFTILAEGELELRVQRRADGRPWEIDSADLKDGLAEAARQIAAY